MSRDAWTEYRARKAQMEKDDIMCAKINETLDWLSSNGFTEANFCTAIGQIIAQMEIAGRRAEMEIAGRRVSF